MSCKSSDPPQAGPAGGSGSGSAAAPGAGTAARADGSGGAGGAAGEGAAARQFAAWLAAFDSGEREKLVAYQQQSFAADTTAIELADVDRALEFREMTGGFELKKTEESTAAKFTGVLKEKSSDQFARATMEVDAGEPHRVRKLQINAIETPEGFRVQRMTEADAIKALRAEIEKAVAADRFAGAVLVAKGGVPIFAEAYGFADRERNIKNTLDTRFRIGSMNKMFTAVATLQLVQARKLDLKAPIGKVIPGYPNQGVATKVTAHHLLTHTGGTGDIFGPEFDAHRLQLRTLQDYVDLYGKRDLELEPGSKWAYSNYGFLLLGIIIEKVTKQSYYDRVAEQVFKPAGMTSTVSPIEEQAKPDGRSIGYSRERPGAPWASAAKTLPYRGTSAGGGDSTVNDLLRFANALTSHKLLDAEHTALLVGGKVDTPMGGGKYAYGFLDAVSDGVRCFGHGGGAPGMNGELAICESGYTIAVLANLDPPAASRLAGFIQKRLPAK